MFVPLREEITNANGGSITAAARSPNDSGQLYDRLQFCFEMRDARVLAARTTITWHYTRNTL
jgi:hypothetical protein